MIAGNTLNARRGQTERHPMGHHPMGHHPMGHHPMGHHPMGHHPMGHHPMGHHPMGHRAFTLVEIMLVVVIIGLLVAAVLPVLSGRADAARKAATRSQMSGIKTALQLYEISIGTFPTSEQGLSALIKCPSDVDEEMWGDKPYLESTPKDAWKRKFIYRYPGDHTTEYDLVSMGRDGQEDTEDDLTNWVDEDE